MVASLVGERFVSPGRFCGGTGTAFAGGPDKRANLFGGRSAELGGAIGWVIWATKAAALFADAD